MSSDTAVLIAIVVCILALIGVIAIIGAGVFFVVERWSEYRHRDEVHELTQGEIEEHLRPWAPSVRNGKVKLP